MVAYAPGVQRHRQRWRVKIYFNYHCYHIRVLRYLNEACQVACWARVILGQQFLARGQRPPPVWLCLLVWRKTRRLSILDMCFRAKVTPLDYSAYENVSGSGSCPVPLPGVLDRLARVLDLSIPELLGNVMPLWPVATLAA